jgi:hypothetical protein
MTRKSDVDTPVDCRRPPLALSSQGVSSTQHWQIDCHTSADKWEYCRFRRFIKWIGKLAGVEVDEVREVKPKEPAEREK